MSQDLRTQAELLGQMQAIAADRQMAMAALQQRDRLNSLLVENSLGLMCSHDLDGVLLSVNPAAAQSLGYRPEDGVGRNLRDFLAPAVRPFFDAYLARIREQPSDSGLMRLVARDGSERIWLYRNVRYEEPGAPPHVLGHALDVTDRLRAEEALRASEARFRTLVDHAPVLIWMASAEGTREFFNGPWLSFTGRTLDQEVGEGWMIGMHPQDTAVWREAYQAAVVGRSEFTVEYRLRRADGAYRWVREMGVPHHKADGRLAGFIGSCIDITADREASEEREARVRAEAALQLRDDVLALAVHDLRAPLTNIFGRADLIALQVQQAGAPLSTRLESHVQALRAAATGMLAIIDEISDVARLQMDQPLPLQLGPVELGELVRAVAEEFTLAGTARVTVGAPAEEVVVRGDRARLLRVVRNLVDNGLKFSPEGAPVHIDVQREGSVATIVVRDRGAGIAAADLPLLFQRYFRAAGANRVRGSGLGLAGAKAIMEQHGGAIAIASTEGEGTSVTLRLPVAPEHNPPL